MEETYKASRDCGQQCVQNELPVPSSIQGKYTVRNSITISDEHHNFIHH